MTDTTVDTAALAALERATASSDQTTANFVDAVLGISYGGVQRTGEVGRPAFTAGDLIPPGTPDSFQVEAMKQLVVGAATSFAARFMPEETAVQAVYTTARARMVEMTSGNSLDIPGSGTPGSYGHDVAQFFRPGGDAYPDYICAPLADALDGYVATTYAAGAAITSADIARDLYEFAIGSVAWRDRSAAMRAVTEYVATVAEQDTLAADTQVRIEQASAAMQAAMAKWVAAQMDGDLDTQVEIARAKKQTAQDVSKNSHEYAAVEARVKTAQAGADELARVVRAARNTIANVIAHNQYVNG